jgi:CheY-like chemotaxis protein
VPDTLSLPRPTTGTSRRVLVADDYLITRLLLRNVLEAEGHEVIEAADGAAALRLAAQAPIDLFLCDLFMPDVDGLEAISRFRDSFPGVPVVALSGGAFGGSVDLLPVAALLGADRVLRKPFVLTELQTLLRELLAVRAEHLKPAPSAPAAGRAC